MFKAFLRWLQARAAAARLTNAPARTDETELHEDARPRCSLCGRMLENAEDELSLDCGGDCWGCIGEIEADMGYGPSLLQVREESAKGLEPVAVEPELVPIIADPYSQDSLGDAIHTWTAVSGYVR